MRRLARLAAATGIIVAGLSMASAAPAATAATAPQKKCDPASGMRVTYSTSGHERVSAHGCVTIVKEDNGRWKVTASVRAGASTKDRSGNWRLVQHSYEQKCRLSSMPVLAGPGMRAEVNRASVSRDGTTEGPCLVSSLAPGRYVFTWTYDRRADEPGSAVSNQGEVTFDLQGGLTDAIVRPMPQA